MSFWLSSHQVLLAHTGPHQLEDPSYLCCKDSTPKYPVDDPLLSCKQQAFGFESRRQLEEAEVAVGSMWAFGSPCMAGEGQRISVT